MKHYLYILPFKDEEYFKIGITSNGFERIFKHDITYGILLKKHWFLNLLKVQ